MGCCFPKKEFSSPPPLLQWALPEKIQTGLRAYFLKKKPVIFRFVTLPLEIPDKAKFHTWKFHKIVLNHLEIPRTKTKTRGNST